jgi:hypothetical protein
MYDLQTWKKNEFHLSGDNLQPRNARDGHIKHEILGEWVSQYVGASPARRLSKSSFGVNDWLHLIGE